MTCASVLTGSWSSARSAAVVWTPVSTLVLDHSHSESANTTPTEDGRVGRLGESRIYWARKIGEVACFGCRQAGRLAATPPGYLHPLDTKGMNGHRRRES